MIETFKVGTQNRRLLERLLIGPVFNYEIRDMGIMNHSGRISDVRRVARDHGRDVTSERVRRGVWVYRIKPLSYSEPEAEKLPPTIEAARGLVRESAEAIARTFKRISDWAKGGKP